MKPILLDAIACPKCHQTLQYDKQAHRLICQHDNLIFAINDGIPVLLESEAKPVPQSSASLSE